jgi:multidrug transporter EmrE-like cation transporter
MRFDWLLLLVAAMLNSIGALLLKKGQMLPGPRVLGVSISIYSITGGFLFAATFLVFARALASLPVAVAYPIFVALSQLMLGSMAVLILAEQLKMIQVFGATLVIVGTMMLTIGVDGK